MRFQCTFCSFILKIEDSLALKKQSVKCPNCSQTLFVPQKPFQEGWVIADFAIQRKIGEGSIGAVYEAIQISLNRTVALKVLSKEYSNAKGIKDFLKEARAAAALNHPNLVQCLAVGEENGTCYMAMNYIKGESIKTKLKKEGKIAVDESLHIVQQVGESLYYAWDEAKIIHRDVKPDNIMITDDGIVKLTDLGLAMQFSDWKADMDISGSPSYMSPEQFSGAPLDTRTDIYSLGITLFQMLTGTLPFNGETVKTIAKQHFEEPPPPVNKVNPKLSQKVANLVNRMLMKHPDDRFQNMEELLNEVWAIRQKTAPDRDLVPDVHTISMKRLDYELQKETAKRHEKETKKRLSLFMKIGVIVFPALLILTIILAIFHVKRRNSDHTWTVKVEQLSSLLHQDNVAHEDLVNRIRSLMSELEFPSTSVEHELKTRLQLYHEQVQLKKLRGDYEQLAVELEKTMRENLKLSQKVALTSHAKIMTEKTIQKTKNALKSEKSQMESNLAKLSDTIKLQKKTIQSLNAKIKSLQKDIEQDALDQNRLNIAKLIVQGKFKEAQAMLELHAERNPSLSKKWVEKNIENIKKMSDLYDVLTDSGTEFAGTPVEKDGRLMVVDKKTVTFQDANNEIKEISWRDLSLESAYMIAKQKFPDMDENTLKSNIALIQGEPFRAKQWLPDDKERQSLCETYINYHIDNIRGLCKADRKKAVEKAKSLLKLAEDADDYDSLKEKLLAIIKSERKKDSDEETKSSDSPSYKSYE